MTENLKSIVQAINKCLNTEFNLISFDSQSDESLLQVLLDVFNKFDIINSKVNLKFYSWSKICNVLWINLVGSQRKRSGRNQPNNHGMSREDSIHWWFNGHRSIASWLSYRWQEGFAANIWLDFWKWRSRRKTFVPFKVGQDVLVQFKLF